MTTSVSADVEEIVEKPPMDDAMEGVLPAAEQSPMSAPPQE